MKKALIIGASGGIGRACHAALVEHGVDVFALSRRNDGFDVTDPVAATTILKGQSGPFDYVLVTLGVLAGRGGAPEKTIRSFDAAQAQAVYAVNTFGPALVMAQLPRLLPRDRTSCFCCLSAKVGSIGDNEIGGWMTYRSSKAALNQMLRTSAIELARTHPKAAAIAVHPGTVETAFTKSYQSRHPTVPAHEAGADIVNTILSATPEQTGRFVDRSGRDLPW